jgi:hypothetical protein
MSTYDSKVSDLPEVTSLNVEQDKLYLAQPGSSKSISLKNLFDNIINPTFRGIVKLDDDIQFLNSDGVLDLSKTITQINVGINNADIDLPDGEESQLKIIVVVGGSSGGTFTLRGNTHAAGNVTFNTRGQTATMLFTSNKWCVIGGNANVI